MLGPAIEALVFSFFNESLVYWKYMENCLFSLRSLQFIKDPAEVMNNKDSMVRHFIRRIMVNSKRRTRDRRNARCGCKKLEHENQRQFANLISDIDPSDIRPKSLNSRYFYTYIALALFVPFMSEKDSFHQRKAGRDNLVEREIELRNHHSLAIESCRKWHENATLISDPMKILENRRIYHDENMNLIDSDPWPAPLNKRSKSLEMVGIKECYFIDILDIMSFGFFLLFAHMSNIDHISWSGQIIAQLTLCRKIFAIATDDKTNSIRSRLNIQKALIVTYINIKLFMVDIEARRMYWRLTFTGIPFPFVVYTGIGSIMKANGSQQVIDLLSNRFQTTIIYFYLLAALYLIFLHRIRLMYGHIREVCGYCAATQMHETLIGSEFRRLLIDDPEVEFRFAARFWGLMANSELISSINSTFVGAYLGIFSANN